MNYSDEMINRRGAKYRVYVVNAQDRDWGHVLRDGREVCSQVRNTKYYVPLVLACELRRRVEGGEFDEAETESKASMAQSVLV